MGKRTVRVAGFTLLELLVVVSIIVLVTATLMPALGKVRHAARATVCMSNQRQLGFATVAYQADHRGSFPQPHQDGDIADTFVRGAALWFNALDAYLNQERLQYEAFDAEERHNRTFKQDPVWERWEPAIQPYHRTIKMNEFLGHGSNVSTPPGGAPVRFYRDTEVPQPSRVVLFVDGRAFDLPSTTGNVDGDEFYVRPAYAGPRHDGGANVAHIDGHVSHQRNPTYLTAGGYVAWFDDDDPDPTKRPASVFNFRP